MSISSPPYLVSLLSELWQAASDASITNQKVNQKLKTKPNHINLIETPQKQTT
jgi:hypothetical protein